MNPKGAAQLAIDFERRVIDTPTREIRGMVRGADSLESQAAAVRVKEHQTWIQRTILHCLAVDGPATAKELEGRIEFRSCGPSSCRKRVSELRQAGLIRQLVIERRPQRREGCAVMELSP